MANYALATVVSASKATVTAGTRVALVAASTIVYDVSIKALAANTGKIYVGSVAVTSSNGYELSAGESVTLGSMVQSNDLGRPPKIDLSGVYIDSSVSGEGVRIIYTVR